MGLTKEQREKRTKLVVMAKRGEGHEADVAAAKVAELDARAAKSEAKFREWGDGRNRKAKPEPVLTEDEKSSALVALGPLQQALAQATAAGDINALQDIASMASALKAGAKARGMGIVSENQAAEVIVRSERAIGSILIAMRKAGTLAKPGAAPSQWTSLDATSIKTLDDLGFGSGTDRNRVAAFQRLASLPDEEFEALLAAKREANERIARVDFIRAVTASDPGERKYRAEAAAEAREFDTPAQVTAFIKAVDDLMSMDKQPDNEAMRLIGAKTKSLIEWFNERRAR